MITFFLALSLVISVSANIVFIWYTKTIVKKLWDTYNGVDKFQEYLEGYMKNSEGVYELTDYYGDQTIKGMIDDTRSVVEACQNFKISIMGQETEEKNEAKTE
jgi:hypothetical protein